MTSTDGSAASSAENTPQRSHREPILLTPRTKVKMLLQTLDSSDTDEPERELSSKQSNGISHTDKRPSAASLESGSREENERETVATPHIRSDSVIGPFNVDSDSEDSNARTVRSTHHSLNLQVSDKLSPTVSRSRSPRSSPSPVSSLPKSTQLSVHSLSSARSIPTDTNEDPHIPVRRRLFSKRKHTSGKSTMPAAEALPTVEPDDDIDDDEAITKHIRPTRGASKKALEEIRRETQRLSRNQLLSHTTQIKKKITKNELFAKFNFRPAVPISQTVKVKRSDVECSSATHGDEGIPSGGDAETPPSSPPPISPTLESTSSKKKYPHVINHGFNSPRQDRIGNKTVLKTLKSAKPLAEQPQQLPRARPQFKVDVGETGSDPGELDIVNGGIFDKYLGANSRAKRPEAEPLRVLRGLAQIKSPGKVVSKKGAQTTNLVNLHSSLRARARKQALAERQERVEDLEARGILVPTKAEAEQEQLEVESMLEKARESARDILKRERKANGLKDAGDDNKTLSEDDEDDGDWENNANEADENDADTEGSDDSTATDGEQSEDEDQDDKSVGDNAGGGEGFLHLQAGEATDNSEADEDESSAEEGEQSKIAQRTGLQERRSHARRRHVIEDEDDESVEVARPEPTQETVVLHSPEKSLPKFQAARAPLSLSQAFAGSARWTNEEEGNSATISEVLPPTEPTTVFNPNRTVPGDGALLVANSQTSLERLQPYAGPSILPEFDVPVTQLSDQLAEQGPVIPDPTPMKYPLMLQTLLPPVGTASDLCSLIALSTADTVLIPVPESPVVVKTPTVVKKQRLHRRKRRTTSVAISNVSGEISEGPNAFAILKQRANKTASAPTFDKKRSGAREMIDEQAEESDDEYAAMGGPSEDDSNDGSDHDVASLIDENEVKVDERKLAAFYA